MIRVAVVGAGHWGPNLIHNFDNHQRSVVRWIADADPRRLEAVRSRFPGARVTTDAGEAIDDADVDAVVVATPTATHHALTRHALERGKHVLVEKPLAASSAEAEDLVALAERARRVLLVGHVFLYNPSVAWIQRCIDAGELGEIHYVSSERTNLGPIRADVDAAWDLASQDIAIFNQWLGSGPLGVSATGGAWVDPGRADAVFATLRYPANVLCHLHVSWLNPRKVRDITIVGERRMLTYDDMNVREPVRVYDKQVLRVHPEYVDTFDTFRAGIRDGDITIPKVPHEEPLRNECQHFLDCVEGRATPLTGGAPALLVVRVLEAIDRSRREAGREVAP